ncbi:MAG: hypothetical protein R2697_06650 [Ilumatobacteraceae bacterium]
MRWLIPDDADYDDAWLPLFGNIARRWHATDSLWCTDDVAAMAGWSPLDGRPSSSDPTTAWSSTNTRRGGSSGSSH